MKNLNTVLYGPPGTGKTFATRNRSVDIVNMVERRSDVSDMQLAYSIIIQWLRANHRGIPRTNSIYRNSNAIMWFFAEFIDRNTNRLTRNDVIDLKRYNSSSSWSQISRFVRWFKLTTEQSTDTELELNSDGIELKNNLAKLFSVEELTNWSGNPLPPVVLSVYRGKLEKQKKESTTQLILEYLVVLQMALEGNLFSYTPEDTEIDEQDRHLVLDYFGLPPEHDKGLKWIYWNTKALEGLGLVEETGTDGRRVTWVLTEQGRLVVEHLVSNWTRDYPELFNEQLSYEVACELGYISFITFHQSYAYEEFVEGIRPSVDGETSISYSVQDGIFKRICRNAQSQRSANFVLIIDEINRANVSKVFGELITLLEQDKRSGEKNSLSVMLPYSKENFSVPSNVYLIGTMNSSDKSIVNIDIALRRRFFFEEIQPDISKVDQIIDQNDVRINVRKVMETLNKRIEYLLGHDYTIGHAYFMQIEDWDDLVNVFVKQILPLVEELFVGDLGKIALLFGDNSEAGKEDSEKLIREVDARGLFGQAYEYEDASPNYEVRTDVKANPELLSPAFFTKGFSI
jgi:hypothetical protein